MIPSLKAQTQKFSGGNTMKSTIELLVSVIGYVMSIALVYMALLNEMYVTYTALCILAGLFAVKNFALFHDCTHGSLYKSEVLNTWVGRILSAVVTMPFTAWKYEHDEHHSHVADIDKVYHGDVIILTVEKYKKSSPLMQYLYRIFRHPLFLLLISPFAYFFIKARIPDMHLIKVKKVLKSVMYTNLCLAAIYIPLMLSIGFWTTFLVFAPALYIGGMIGIALFYLQHDYPDAAWFTSDNWEFEHAALHGSSLLVLPQLLDWFSHSIGYHHVHHVNSKIPGYKLRECYKEVQTFNEKKPLTWKEIVKAFELKFWSHEKNRLVTLSEAKNLSS